MYYFYFLYWTIHRLLFCLVWLVFVVGTFFVHFFIPISSDDSHLFLISVNLHEILLTYYFCLEIRYEVFPTRSGILPVFHISLLCQHIVTKPNFFLQVFTQSSGQHNTKFKKIRVSLPNINCSGAFLFAVERQVCRNVVIVSYHKHKW